MSVRTAEKAISLHGTAGGGRRRGRKPKSTPTEAHRLQADFDTTTLAMLDSIGTALCSHSRAETLRRLTHQFYIERLPQLQAQLSTVPPPAADRAAVARG
jgi:hypothetical protein